MDRIRKGTRIMDEIKKVGEGMWSWWRNKKGGRNDDKKGGYESKGDGEDNNGE